MKIDGLRFRKSNRKDSILEIPSELNAYRGILPGNNPGFFHVNKINDASILYLDEAGCNLFGLSLEEIEQMGSDFLLHYMHPDDRERCVALLSDFVAKGDEKEVLSYFQRVRLSLSSDEYVLALTTLKLDLKNEVFVCITNTTDQLPLFTKKITEALAENSSTKQRFEALDLLTKRERQVATCMCNGLNAKRISVDLYISNRTVEQHKKNIYKKLQVNNLAGLLQYKAFLT